MNSISIDINQDILSEHEINIWKELISRTPKDELRLIEILLSKHRPLLQELENLHPGKVVIPLTYIEMSIGRFGVNAPSQPS